MKAIRIGEIPVEFFTGVGELRSHDKACNNMTREEAMRVQQRAKLDFKREVIIAFRKERKQKKKLKKLGIDYGIKIMGCGVSTRDLLK